MAATAAARATRYFQPGITKVVLIDTVADIATVTRAEIDGGTDISFDISGVSGWRVTADQISTPALGERFVPQIPGRINTEASSITSYASEDGIDLRDELTLDQDVYVVFMDGGDVPTNKMDVYKTTVASVGKVRDLEDAPKVDVQFTIRAYDENQAVPAVV